MSSEFRIGINGRPLNENELRVFRKVAREEREQSELLRREFNAQFNEDFSGMAFNIGLTPEEMRTYIEEDPVSFTRIYAIAIDGPMEFTEAARIYEKEITQGQVLLDRVGLAYNRKTFNHKSRKFPKPENLYQREKPKRRKKTKGGLVARAQGYLRWKNAQDALNTEKAALSDLDQNPFRPGE